VTFQKEESVSPDEIMFLKPLLKVKVLPLLVKRVKEITKQPVVLNIDHY